MTGPRLTDILLARIEEALGLRGAKGRHAVRWSDLQSIYNEAAGRAARVAQEKVDAIEVPPNLPGTLTELEQAIAEAIAKGEQGIAEAQAAFLEADGVRQDHDALVDGFVGTLAARFGEVDEDIAAGITAANDARDAALAAAVTSGQVLTDVQGIRDQTLAYRDASDAAKTAAELARTQAQSQATNAAGSAAAAAGSATTATTKATEAGNSAAAASASAVAANSSAGAAGTSASAAATSATSAATQASAASTSAAAANTAKLAAETAKGAAEIARDEAVTSKTDAQGAATTATTQATLSVNASNASRDITAKNFPSDFLQDGAFFALNEGGGLNPSPVDSAKFRLNGATRVFFQTGFAILTTRAFLPAIPGRVYYFEAKVRVTADSTVTGGGKEQFLLGARGYLADGSTSTVLGLAGGANSVNPARVANGEITLSGTLTVGASPAFALIRPRLYMGFDAGGNGNATWEVSQYIVRDVTESTLAAGSASAAATSASAASASATAAGQQASAAETSKINAQTAESGAISAKDAAVTASSTAQGAASTASTASTLSASASRTAQAAASGNMMADPALEDAPTGWSASLNGPVSRVTHGQSGTNLLYAVRVANSLGSGGLFSPYSAAIPGGNRTYRISGKYRTTGTMGTVWVGAAVAFGGVTGAATVVQIGAAQANFTAFSVEQTRTADHDQVRFRGIFQSATGAASVEFTDIVIEDITAQTRSESALAASEIARNETVTAKDTAVGASTSAATSLSLTSRIVGQGNGVLLDQFLDVDSGWATWTTAPTWAANTKFPRGREATFALAQGTQGGIQLSSGDASWPGAVDSPGYYVEVDFTLNTGSLSGAGILVDWNSTAPATFRTQKTLASMVAPQTVLAGRMMTARGVFKEPETFTGTFSLNRIYVIANWSGFGETLAAKNITIHRIYVRVATAEEMGGGQVLATLSQTFATSTSVDSAISAVSTDLSGQIGTVSGNLSQNYYTKTATDSAISAVNTSLSGQIGSINTNLSQNYYTKTATDSAIAAVNTSLGNQIGAINTNLTNNYYTKTGTDSAIAAVNTSLSAQIDNVGAEGVGLQRTLTAVANVTVGAAVTVSLAGAIGGQSNSLFILEGTTARTFTGQTNGASIEIPAARHLLFAGQRVKIGVLAKRAATNTATKFGVAYTCADGNSGYMAATENLTTSLQWFFFYYTVPASASGGPGYLGIFGDDSKTGKRTQVAKVFIEIAATVADVETLPQIKGNVDAIMGLDLNALNGTALAFMLNQLQVEAGGNSAWVTSQSSAVASLSGQASALYSFRVGAGGASAGLELVANANALGGPSATVKISANNIGLFGDVLVSANNLFPDFDCMQDGFWSGAGFVLAANSNVRVGRKMVEIAADALVRNVYSGWFNVDPGVKYLASAAAWTGAGTSGTSQVYLQTAPVSSSGVVDVGALTETLVKARTDAVYNDPAAHGSVEIAVPSTHAVARFRVRRPAGGDRLARAGAFQFKEKYGSDLLVEGGIFARHITASEAVITSSAQLGTAVVGTAQIGNAQITTAKIGDLQVSTLKIGDNAVTIPVSSFTGTEISLTTSEQTVASVALNRAGISTRIEFSAGIRADQSTGSVCVVLFKLYRGSTLLTTFSDTAFAIASAFNSTCMVFSDNDTGTGNTTYSVTAALLNSNYAGTLRNRHIGAQQFKK